MIRKKIIIIIVILLSLFCLFPKQTFITQAEEENEDIEENLKNEIESQLNSLDFSEIENVLNNLTEDQFNIFGANSFLEKIKKIISGEYAENESSIFSAVLNIIFDELLLFLPIVATIISISILCGFLNSFKQANNSKTLGDIVHFVCYSIIITIISGTIVSLVKMTTQTITLLKTQMGIIFPILLTILTAMGGTTSVTVYQPLVVLLSGTITHIFTTFLVPIFLFALVFSIASNMSKSIKLDKFTSFFTSLFKWTIGIIFTIFTAFLSIQGITASGVDGVSIRTAKFAIKSFIPILGGYLSDGFNVILASSVLIKNAIGASGLILMLASVILPVLKLIIFMLTLKLAAAVLQPLSDSRISSFIYSVSKSVSMLITIILGIAFMYLITIGLIMCTFNYV